MNDERQREKLKSITFQKGKLTDVWIEEATEITQADFEIIDFARYVFKFCTYSTTS